MRSLVFALLLAPAFALAQEEQRPAAELEEWDPDLPIEAQRETEEARTTSRFAVSANFGFLSDPGGSASSSSSGNNLGPSFVLEKPFWVGTRRRYNQFLLEVRTAAGWVPSKFVLLTMSPMWGANFYFGPYVGIETRVGLGFGSQLSANSHFGVAFQAESGIVVRCFPDDRIRLKILGGVGMQVFFDKNVGGLSAWVGTGFETVL